MSHDLGLDRSGNNNNWSVNNMGISDQMLDTPTNNFATLNPLVNVPNMDYYEGNLKSSNSAINEHKTVYGTMAISSGKWYWEAEGISGTKLTMALTDTNNVDTQQVATTNFIPGYQSPTYADGDAVSVYYDDLRKNGSVVTADIFPSYISSGEIISIAFDADTGNVWFAMDGVWTNGSAASSTTLNASYPDTTVSTTANSYTPAWASESSTWIVNFGQDSSFAGNKTAQGNQDSGGIGDFYYTPPTGFLALCTANLAAVAVVPSKHFNTILYTGTGGGVAVRDVGFRPNLIWGKKRSPNAQNHWLINDVSGIGKWMASDNDSNEGSEASGTAFVSNGFDTSSNDLFTNNTSPYVVWNWKGNGTGTPVSNTDGTITTTVSANVDAGFSIISYTGNLTANATIGHGLSKAPELYIIKNRTLSGGYFWHVQHKDLTINGAGGTNHIVRLNTTHAAADDWEAPMGATSTVIKLTDGSSSGATNDDDGMICYAWHSVDGYSKISKYSANGNADGPFVYTGFRPAYVILKASTQATGWAVKDNARDTYNPTTTTLFPDTNIVEYSSSSSSDHFIDFVSNGFKIRNTNGRFNTSGQTYIYMAFAETPFKYSNAR